MKQYFTGFFTATCLVSSIFIFIGAQNTEFGDIKAHSISIINNDGDKIQGTGRKFLPECFVT